MRVYTYPEVSGMVITPEEPLYPVMGVPHCILVGMKIVPNEPLTVRPEYSIKRS